MIDTSKHIWEGWTVGDFIEVLQPQLELIKEVVDYFAEVYGIGN